MRVTPVKGPTIRPISPDTLNRDATTLGVIPRDAIMGIRIGAMTALPPPSVPRRPQMMIEQMISAILALVCVLTPMRLTIQ